MTAVATKKLLGRVVLNLAWITIATVFYWIAVPYASVRTFDPVGPHVFPQIVSVIIIVCAVGNLFIIFLSTKKDKPLVVDIKEAQQIEGTDFRNLMKVVLIVILSGIYIVILNWIGYLLSTILLIFFLVLIQGGIKLSKNLMISCGFSLFLYIVFSRILNILLPEGLLGFIFT